MKTVQDVVNMQHQTNVITGGMYKHWVVVFMDSNNIPQAADARSPIAAINGFRIKRPDLRVGAIIGMASRAEADAKVRTINGFAKDLERFVQFANDTDQQIGKSLVEPSIA
jgi:hypothetical protein